jgi:glycosyltransferase involved in cell wall biosynthesis
VFAGNQKNVERYYNACDVTALPSLFEGTPNVALESMACGVPVVATNVSDNAYIVPDGRAGFVVASNDAKSMADRLVRLAQDRELRARMSREARAWVMKEFSCARLAEKTLAVYREAVAMKAGEKSAVVPVRATSPANS